MAHIPYGYRIEEGQAVVDPEKSRKLKDFFDAYLGGLSVKEARNASEIELEASSLSSYMRSGTYAGTDYYPAIVSKGTFHAIIKEMEKRTHPGTSIFSNPQPVKENFHLHLWKEPLDIKGIELIEKIYEAVVPSADGTRSITDEEMDELVTIICGNRS